MTKTHRWSLAACLLALGTPSLAHASNTRHPRTPVIWEGVAACGVPEIESPCMTLHDRGDGPLHIPYGIPYEDTDVGPDEAPQSRTHQFVAFCRQHPFSEAIPSWMTAADVTASEVVGQVMPGEVPTSDILELRDDWDDCWFRIVDDADRRPITCEMAEQGVDWDASAVPAGVYAIDAYTYEPALNFWVLRPGVVKLHDGDPDAVGPAAAVSTREFSVHRNQIAMVEGCADAPADSTFTAYWAKYTPDLTEPEWVALGPAQALEGDAFEIEFAPPEALFGEFGMLRVDVEDPSGRIYTAHMADKFVVINADGPDACGGTGSFIGGSSCDESGDGSSGSSGAPSTGSGGPSEGSTSIAATSSEGTGPGATSSSGDGGCGCGGAPAAPWLSILALVRRRRPRSHGHPRRTPRR